MRLGRVNLCEHSIFFQLDAIDLSGKPVALYGMDDLSDKVIQLGAEPVGFWLADESYEFEYSRAVIDGVFVGLALDEDNQDNLSKERIHAWVAIVLEDFRLAVPVPA